MKSLTFWAVLGSILLLPFMAVSQLPVEKKNIKALVVGVSRYQHLESLEYADRDAEAFARHLLESGHANPEDVKVFLNEDAVSTEIYFELEMLTRHANENDLIIFYFSGHGDVENVTISKKGFLLTHDCGQNSYYSHAIGLNYLDDFVASMSNKGAQVHVIVDACKSGKLSGGREGAAKTSSVLQQTVSNEVRILSCMPDEYSLEGKQWGEGRGLFSFALINALQGAADLDKDQNLTLFELGSYVIPLVKNLAAPNRQNPVIPMHYPWRIPYATFQSTDPVVINKDEMLSDVATRGNAIFFSDSIRLDKMEQLIRTGKLNSAYELYLVMVENAKLQGEKELLQRKMSSALLNHANAFITRYLEENELDVTTGEIRQNIQYLEKAMTILSEFKILGDYLLSKKLFYESLFESHEGNLEEALAKLNESVKLEPEASYVHNELGLIYRKMGKTSESIAAFTQSIQLTPGWFIPRFNICEMLEAEKRYGEAITHYEFLIDAGFDRDYIYLNAGYCYLNLKNLKKAETMLLKALELAPGDAFTNYNLSQAYLMNGDFEKVIVYSKRTTQLITKSDEIWHSNQFTLAVAYFETQQHSQATKILEGLRSAANSANNAEVLQLLTICYYAQRSDAQAKQVQSFYKSIFKDDRLDQRVEIFLQQRRQ